MTRKSQLPHQELLENRVLAICHRLEELLDLQWQEIAHVFNRGGDDDTGTACTASAKWQYRLATLTWNLDALVSQTDEQIEEIAIHEYIHILCGPIQEYLPSDDTAREEFVTESLARVFVKLMRQIGASNV